MNRVTSFAFLFCALGMALIPGAAAAYPVVTIDGVLDNVSDGTFDVVVEVSDDRGQVLVTETVPSLVIVGGVVSVDVDLDAATLALEDGEVLSLTVDVGELSVTTRLGSVLFADLADDADLADIAIVAERLGDVPAASLVQVGNVDGVAVAFENVVGLPNGIADGDDGNVFTLAGLVVTGGALEVAPASVTTGRIIDGTITGTQIQDGSITSVQTGNLAADRLADATLTGRNFANDAFSAADIFTVTVNRMAPGCENPSSLSTFTTCRREACGTNRLRDCTTRACEDVGTNPPLSVQLCSGSGEGITPVSGRLVQ